MRKGQDILEKILKNTDFEMYKIFLQRRIETRGIKLNKGECYTYNICHYCKAKGKIFLDSDTPCADAYIEMEKQTGKKVTFKHLGSNHKNKYKKSGNENG